MKYFVLPLGRHEPVHQTTRSPSSWTTQAPGGFPIRWEISGEYARRCSSMERGRLVRILAHVREQNALTNPATERTISDDPAFDQLVRFDEDGTISSIETTAASA